MYKDIKIKTLILCLCSFYFNTTEQLMAQSVFGEVQYSQTNDWTKIATALPYLSQRKKTGFNTVGEKVGPILKK